jgi:hypothetical protein
MTWYVSPKTGQDSNDGHTVETAFKNLFHAIESASAGDTILLVPAPYAEELPKLIVDARAAGVTVGVLGG